MSSPDRRCWQRSKASSATIRETARRNSGSATLDCRPGTARGAEPAFHAAAAAGLPGADVQLGLATCLGQRGDLAGAERALAEARRIEPDNPAVIANLGLVQASKGDFAPR